jgi:hypothetical protein
VLQPGERGGFKLEVGNVGDVQAKGWPTVQVTLPPGVIFDENDTDGGFGWSCGAAGTPQVVTCANPFASFFSFLWPKANTYVGPGTPIYIDFTVELEASAPAGTHPVTVAMSGAEAAEATTVEAQVQVGGPAAGFGIAGALEAEAIDAEGNPYTQAGGHPFEAVAAFTTTKRFNEPDPAESQTWNEMVEPVANIKDVVVDLPAGFSGDPLAAPQCPQSFVESGGDHCLPEAQIGVAEVNNIAGPQAQMAAVYNVVPEKGTPAQFMFNTGGGPVLITPELRSDGGWALSANVRDITEANPLFHSEVRLWGIPADPSHDELRCEIPSHVGPACPGWNAGGVDSSGAEFHSPSFSTEPRRALLTMPTECGGQPETTTLHMASWLDPGAFTPDGDPDLSDSDWKSYTASAPPITGCEKLEFEPSLKARPTINATDSPSGLDVDLHIPQPPSEINVVGQTQVCEVGNWTESPTNFAFQWLRNGAPIAAATASEYETQNTDVGASVQCQVTASSAAPGAGLATSTPLYVPPAPNPVPGFGVPTVSGTVEATGGSLSCDPGTWQEGAIIAYQWFKDGAPLAGEDEATYTAPSGEAPATYQCRVTATTAGASVVAFSAGEASEPAPTPAPPNHTTRPFVRTLESEVPLGAAHLKDVTVTLPEGLVVNPSGANGLGACSEDQANLDNRLPDECPESAKIGKVLVETPVLADPIPGSVFVAAPHDNPFNSLLAIYIALDDGFRTGIVGKIAGKVTPNPQTGRLTATFERNPQLPFEDFHLDFFGGAAASLRTPVTCGTFTTNSELTPWSAPHTGPPVQSKDAWQITKGAPGKGCVSSEAQLPNTPGFEAGSASPVAGEHSPLVVNLRRDDGTQQFGSVTLTPPQGLVAKLAGTATCSDGALAEAERRGGRAEQSSPSCPASSRLGEVTAGAGAGPAPYYAEGTAYLAGPYKGAPLSMAIVTPAVAGPFDLGTIVVRIALAVNPVTAQITATSDPIPQILEGIPLDVRSVQVRLDKPDFTLNPTSCDPTQVTGQLVSTLGATAGLANPFQVGECGRLGFKPRLSIRLIGPPNRGAHPRLRAVLRPRAGDTNIATASVTLPGSELLENAHIRTICTRPQFAADACPKGSVYGRAVAHTPLLDEPLRGPVYLRANGGERELPDLVAALRGPDRQPIEVELIGYIDSVRGRIRNRFELVPDAPVSKFVLTMQGRRKGLLVNSTNICRGKHRATALFQGHNGKERIARPLVKGSCGKAKRKGKGARRGAR